jgi:hypothetical protein
MGMIGSARHRIGGLGIWVIAPMLFLLAIGLFEIGRLISHAGAVKGGVRAAALYAAENRSPLSAGVVARVENIVRTGDPKGQSGYLAAGLAGASATVQVHELSFDHAGRSTPVIRVSATVPYEPVLSRLLPVPALVFEMSHDQVFKVD